MQLSTSLTFCVLALGLAQEPEGQAITGNPYHKTTAWRVWRDDPAPIADVASMIREDKEEKHVTITVEPIAEDARLYPLDEPEDGALVGFATSDKPSARYAGAWDDVYSSWSGLHGYVRSTWRGVDGSRSSVLDQIMHFVDGKKADMLRLGVNFVHQSTTGMAHTITNGYSLGMTRSYEDLYFADCLITSPAHNSFTDLVPERSRDLYIAHVATLFNSVGSSNSETMAITKMITVGAYLPPETKLLLKRNGLYPAALLFIWKAALPYDEPYGHELRHRVAYKAVGDREAYPEKYSAAGIDKGDASLAFHQYDDLAHMRNMIALARSMDVAPPEAIFDVSSTGAGVLRYALKKAAVVVQEAGEDVVLQVDTGGSYDLQGLPVGVRWTLLYGNRQTQVEQDPEDPSKFTVRVPWDDALPEGRTALALIANNGRFDSNPAILTIYRNKSSIPPNGGGPKDYNHPLTFTNLRPFVLDMQAQTVKPGKQLEFELQAIDPEGFPLRFHKRAGALGELDGNVFSWSCPRGTEEGSREVSLILSDGTSGNSYGGGKLTIHVGEPQQLAHITADVLHGPAPLTVEFSAKQSLGRDSRTTFAWSFSASKDEAKPLPFEERVQGREQQHTFDAPGLYTVQLVMRDRDEATEDQVTEVRVWVSAADVPSVERELRVESNGVRIAAGDETPVPFDHTSFGSVPLRRSLERRFLITNVGTKAMQLGSRTTAKLSGPETRGFKIVQMPRKRLGPGASTELVIAFSPRKPGEIRAQVVIGSGSHKMSFHIAARGD